MKNKYEAACRECEETVPAGEGEVTKNGKYWEVRHKDCKITKERGFWATIYTDASLKDGLGSYGYWIKSTKGRIIDQGVFKNRITDSNQAEMQAILKGMTRALSAWDDLEGMLIVTDSKVAQKVFWKGTCEDFNGNPKPEYANLVKIYKELLEKHNLEVRIKWVKGHQRINDIRAFINDFVDTKAKEARIKEEENKEVW